MAATDPSPFSHWQVPADDILRFKVQATNVEPRVSAQLASWLKDTSGQWPCRPRLRLTRRDVRIRLEGLHPACKYTVDEIKAIKAKYRTKTKELKKGQAA